MREIKFRAWNTKEKRMFTPLTIDWLPGQIPPKGPVRAWYQRSQVSDDGEWITNFELMQYAGLKDTNGKDIYEGDIVKSGMGIMRVVEFVNGSYWLTQNDGEEGTCRLDDFRRYAGDGKYEIRLWVIGNIYENTRLLGNNKNEN